MCELRWRWNRRPWWQTLSVGRSSSCDVVLPTEVVSRHHLDIAVGAEALTISDRGSANGTFIDGRRIVGTAHLTPGHVLLVGDVLFRVHLGEPPVEPPVPWAEPPLRDEHEPRYAIRHLPFRTTLARVPLASLLRLFCVLKKSGEYVLSSPDGVAVITLHKGQIDEIVIGDATRTDRAEALRSLLGWDGTFEAVPNPGLRDPSTELLSLDEVLPASEHA